ncbi:hypothetical protein AB0P23_18665 [Rhodococcus sp. NPDC077669]|jgi:hypothetical protein|uniref:hypothetical protein n=1 Tax=Rhodococcus sp. NPDC077669 TaxID=3155174 RepID=UPI00342FDB13
MTPIGQGEPATAPGDSFLDWLQGSNYGTFAAAVLTAIILVSLNWWINRRHGRWEALTNDAELAEKMRDTPTREWLQDYIDLRVRAYGQSETAKRRDWRSFVTYVPLALITYVLFWMAFSDQVNLSGGYKVTYVALAVVCSVLLLVFTIEAMWKKHRIRGVGWQAVSNSQLTELHDRLKTLGGKTESPPT